MILNVTAYPGEGGGGGRYIWDAQPPLKTSRNIWGKSFSPLKVTLACKAFYGSCYFKAIKNSDKELRFVKK